ncbi:MAG TPA: L-threonylcarbamoyladenylate synthase [Kofleriaceae bacterium]|nr:L-threonylcarbamoyladenylate synthase [Kofleriaceae bacterium]
MSGSGDVALAAAIAALAAGELVCFPTETTYGLAADIRRADALARLVALKGRDPNAPFATIAADAAQAAALARVFPPRAAALAARHWPGPLTLVVPARADLAPELVGPGRSVGVRVSSHPLARALAAGIGGPITATSANPSGGAPALDVAEARAYFGDRVAVYLDGGRLTPGASTVVSIDELGGLRVLRPGPIEVDPRDRDA